MINPSSLNPKHFDIDDPIQNPFRTARTSTRTSSMRSRQSTSFMSLVMGLNMWITSMHLLAGDTHTLKDTSFSCSWPGFRAKVSMISLWICQIMSWRIFGGSLRISWSKFYDLLVRFCSFCMLTLTENSLCRNMRQNWMALSEQHSDFLRYDRSSKKLWVHRQTPTHGSWFLLTLHT